MNPVSIWLAVVIGGYIGIGLILIVFAIFNRRKYRPSLEDFRNAVIDAYAKRSPFGE